MAVQSECLLAHACVWTCSECLYGPVTTDIAASTAARPLNWGTMLTTPDILSHSRGGIPVITIPGHRGQHCRMTTESEARRAIPLGRLLISSHLVGTRCPRSPPAVWSYVQADRHDPPQPAAPCNINMLQSRHQQVQISGVVGICKANGQ